MSSTVDQYGNEMTDPHYDQIGFADTLVLYSGGAVAIIGAKRSPILTGPNHACLGTSDLKELRWLIEALERAEKDHVSTWIKL